MSATPTARPRDTRRVLLPNLVLAASVTLTLIAAYFVSSAAAATDGIRFDTAVKHVGDTIDDRIEIYIALLRSAGSLFDASDNVTHDEFRTFVSSMRVVETYPGVIGIGYAQRIDGTDRTNLTETSRQLGLDRITVWPETREPAAFPIVFIEPETESSAGALGFDMYSEPVRRAAMDAAGEAAQVTMSAPVQLVTSSTPGDRPGFVIYDPVYRAGAAHGTIAERRAAIAGYVFAPFRASDLFAALFAKDKTLQVDFRIYDGAAGPENLIFDSRGDVGNAALASRFVVTRQLDVPGRTWTIEYAARPEFELGSSRKLTYDTLFAGLVVSILLFLVSRSQVKARTDAERFADELLASRERLSLSETRFRRFVDSDLIGIEIVDVTGRLVEANDAFLSLVGYVRGDLAGDVGLTWDRVKPPERRDADVAALGEIAARNANATYETEYVRQDGTPVPVLEGLTAIGGPDHTVIGFTLDLTERNRVERDRLALLEREREARQLAEQANRLKDEFLATVSHELRTPLNAILGWARLLGMGRLDAATSTSALETIERNARTQAQLIEDLLDVSRIISGNLRLTVEPVDLVPIIGSALEAVRPAARAKGIAIETALDEQTGTVSGDATRLQQIVWNLISNAVKFTPRGGTVRASLAAEDTYAQIRVSDTGPGIEREFLPYVFERFRQADSSITRAHGGLGLGLAIVRHLAEMHGGSVSADSEGLGHGASFTVRLPLMGVRLDDTVPDDTPILELSLAGIRVLVVDDDTDSRDVLAMALGQYGAEVRTCANGEQAIDDLASWQPNVLVSDIAMPGMNGHELIRSVRSRSAENGGSIPAIALSAYSRGEDQRQSLAAGYQVHLTKPFEQRTIAAEIARLVERGK